MRHAPKNGSVIIHPCFRFLSTTLLSSIGLALLALGLNDLTIEAARGTTKRDVRKVQTDATRKQRASADYGRLPLSFVKNEGQTDPRVDFVSRGAGYAMFLLPGGETTLVLSGSRSSVSRDPDPAGLVAGARPHGAPLPAIAEKGHTPRSNTGTVLRLKLVGADRKARAEGRQQLPGKVNYLLGKDRQQWRTEIPTFARVAYEGIYPGVDLVYYGNQRQLEYDFIVYPGGNPRAITLEADGADRIEIDNLGDLVLHVGDRQVRHRKPLVYQMAEGARREIEGRYERHGVRQVKFQLAAYDRTLPLVIDPVLVYSTYLGGTLQVGADDVGAAVTVDGTGNAYVTGYTASTDFPTTTGASYNGNYDVFITKLDPTGAALVYSTYLGGDNFDSGQGVAVDAAGSAYVTGYTYSSDFSSDVFVTKLDLTGAALVYSTFLGGNNDDAGEGVAVDGVGSAYVTGSTSSFDFPTTAGAFDTTWDAGSDAFVTKLGPTGAAPAYSTFLGGGDTDVGQEVAIDAAGSA